MDLRSVSPSPQNPEKGVESGHIHDKCVVRGGGRNPEKGVESLPFFPSRSRFFGIPKRELKGKQLRDHPPQPEPRNPEKGVESFERKVDDHLDQLAGIPKRELKDIEEQPLAVASGTNPEKGVERGYYGTQRNGLHRYESRNPEKGVESWQHHHSLLLDQQNPEKGVESSMSFSLSILNFMGIPKRELKARSVLLERVGAVQNPEKGVER